MGLFVILIEWLKDVETVKNNFGSVCFIRSCNCHISVFLLSNIIIAYNSLITTQLIIGSLDANSVS